MSAADLEEPHAAIESLALLAARTVAARVLRGTAPDRAVHLTLSGPLAARQHALELGVASVDRLLGPQPGPPLTITAIAQRGLDRRLADLRARGVTLYATQHGQHEQWWRQDVRTTPGRRRSVRSTPVDGPLGDPQARLHRARTAARNAALQLAAGRGIVETGWRLRRGRRLQQLVDLAFADRDIVQRHARQVTAAAVRVAHDHVMEVAREAAWERMDSDAAVEGWTRKTHAGACGACLGLANGVVHTRGQRHFATHGRCRCIAVPVAPGVPRPRTGEQTFRRMSANEQDRLFHGRGGAAKAELLRTGQIRMQDLVATADRPHTDYVLGETPLRQLARDAAPVAA